MALRPPQLEHTLFVYGTLKRLFTNHVRYLGVAEARHGARFAARAESLEKYPLVVRPPSMLPATCGPVLMDKPGTGHRIAGEIFHVDNKCLEAMDILEGVKAGYYYKKTIKVQLLDKAAASSLGSEEVSCISYFFPGKEELLALPYTASYSADHHAQYRPGPVNTDILELCSAERDVAAPTHTLCTADPRSIRTHCLRLLPGDDIVQVAFLLAY
eukprot:TRINITY_DN37006_c0_g1_i1.p1 TRINITY_DN37006_c0_g1~~TRINITY_DN37006_c0_g1_i1.p1  ORF type:complete len:231 (+),score=37.88 TRINITY_DN37006_c0_g1_i1:53-694(+)